MNCAVYARVSTTDQNCDMQLRELREYCARRGWIVAGEYIDTGFSGAKASRPALDRCMKDAREHRVDCIVVWKIDRFSRSMLHLNQQLTDLTSWGVRFIATSQNIDTDQANPTSRLLLQILGAVAEFERETIRERVKVGMMAARHRGACFGRPKVILDRARVEALHNQGVSVRDIAAKLKLSRGTVHRCIQSIPPPAPKASKKGQKGASQKSLPTRSRK